MNKGTLYLIPTPIGKQKENHVLPEHTISMVQKLRCFIVEKPQTTQSFLQWIKHPVPDFELTFRVLNKKTPDQEIFSFLNLLKDQDVGLMSEAGAPGVADPGAKLVKLAHDNGIRVVPLVGPSAILMALMSSGMNGQKFAFHGYLSINENKRIQELASLEQQAIQEGQTQIFMETPHRNESLFSLLLSRLRPETRLCVACNITMPDELIETKAVHQWKSGASPDLNKKPALFVIGN
ncbi:MAG: SAM-dependent methyltransferase [Balneolaceae bacterium]|nr:SAM-dependent methyltransferase [Balneolaceae bacterium]MCH8549220.1 SAM-dependent methyltransferase [Balneolaceae bacterium]